MSPSFSGERISQGRYQHEAGSKEKCAFCLLYAGFLFDLLSTLKMDELYSSESSVNFLVSGKLLITFASTVILGFGSCGTHDHSFLLYD
jgi:hypothetical protein